MNLTRHIVLGTLVASFAISASAKPAWRGVQTVIQPDGTELRITKTGDEYLHFTTTEDGRILVQDADGWYNFATIAEDGATVSTGIRASMDVTSSKAVNIKDVDIEKIARIRNIENRVSQTHTPFKAVTDDHSRMKAPQTGLGLVSSTYPRTGHPKGLIILVQYADVSFTLSDPAYYFNDAINGEKFRQYGGTGSALQYFSEQSNGIFVPSFDVYGPVTLPYNRAYYGANDRYGNDDKAHYMVKDAIEILDPEVDFSQYDTDNDGLIDNVYIIYAGQGEAGYGGADTVWPHSWDIRYGNLRVFADGVQAAHYACSNETENKTPDGIGTFVHEFSHVMGLPDLYHTTSQVTYTPGYTSVLDYGPYLNNGRTPPNYSAYERNAMGWSEPIMIDRQMSVTLNPITSGDFALIPTEKTTEFYLLENRQQTGWDTYLPCHGMLVWHVDYVKSVFEGNTVNNNKNHQYVDVVEANNVANGYSNNNVAGYTFPGTTGKTSFTSTTSPALKSWAGRAINYPVTDIKETDGIITFNVLGGVDPLDTPVANTPTPGADDRYFNASWNSIKNATDYYLTVTAREGDVAGVHEANFDGQSLPTGWTCSGNPVYNTAAGNSGAAAPSFKLGTDGASLTSPETDTSVSKIQFWTKGVAVGTSGTILWVEGLVNNEWIMIEGYSMTTKAQNLTIDDVPEGVKAVRFVMEMKSGSIALDDIVITYGGHEVVLPDYNFVSTGGATNVKVDKLKPGYNTYSFTVKASDGAQLSDASAPVTIKVPAMVAGVDDIVVDSDFEAAPEYFNLQGIRVSIPTPGSVVIERRGNKARKIIVK